MSLYTNIPNPGVITGSVTAGGIAGTGTSTVTISGAGSGYTLNTGAGSNGSYLVSTGAVSGTTTSWVSPNTNFYSSNQKAIMTIPYGEDKMVLDKAATLEINGTVKMNGMDLDDRLKTIEKVLCIPQRDVIMETKYPKLAELYKQYMHELEKYKTWESIKGDDDGTT